MATILLSANCPLPQAPAAGVVATSGVPLTSTTLAGGVSAGTANTVAKFNENALRSDLGGGRYAAGYSVGYGCALTAGSGLSLPVAAGQLCCDGVVDILAVNVTLAPVASVRYWIWGSRSGVVSAVAISAPPAGAQVLLGSALLDSGGANVASVDYSGVVYRSPGGILYTSYADAHAPTTSPPAGMVGLRAFTLGGNYEWTGTAWQRLGPALSGTATLVAGTVTVATTAVTASSRIFLTTNTPGGTPGWLQVSARTAGTSFTILSSSGTDTSVVAWQIIEP